MGLAQSADPLFDRLQVVAQGPALPHFSLAPGFRRRRDDGFLVDIESEIEFFFHWCVCWFFVVTTATLRDFVSRPLVQLCSRAPAQESPADKYERQTHSLFQRPVRSLSPRAQP
jgi:hypothetical protein